MDGRRPCQRCALRLFDREAVTLWCGRHFRWLPNTEQAGATVTERQEYVIVLCQGCAALVWPVLCDTVLSVGRADPPVVPGTIVEERPRA